MHRYDWSVVPQPAKQNIILQAQIGKYAWNVPFVGNKFMATLNKQDVSLTWACQIANRLVCKQAKK